MASLAVADAAEELGADAKAALGAESLIGAELPTSASDLPAQPQAAPPEALAVDCRLPLRSVQPATYTAIRGLAPYGVGFPPPLFVAQGVRVLRCWPSGPEGRNLRLIVSDGVLECKALWPKQGALRPLVQQLNQVDVVYTLDASIHAGTEEYLMRVVALDPVAAEPTADSAQPPT
jgi:single-stranded-DNA-specific exonuclease